VLPNIKVARHFHEKVLFSVTCSFVITFKLKFSTKGSALDGFLFGSTENISLTVHMLCKQGGVQYVLFLLRKNPKNVVFYKL